MNPFALSIQIVDNKDCERLNAQVSDLQQFVRLLGLDLLKMHADNDIFLLRLPQDDYEAVQVINIVYSFCALRRWAVEAESEPLSFGLIP